MNKKLLYIVLVVAVFLVAVILYLQRTFSPLTIPAPSPTVSVTDSITPSTNAVSPTLSPTGEDTSDKKRPSVAIPKPNAQVSSPVTITGTVPPGWMFEGVFPVKLLDAQRKVITQSPAKEVTPGSWTSGNDVAFHATIDFETTAKSGFIVLENDNPSGLPENADSFEIPITFD